MVTLNELIETSDKTLYMIGKETGINRTTINNIRDGITKNVKKKTALILCEYFSVDIKEVKDFQSLYEDRGKFGKLAKKKDKLKIKKETKSKKKEVVKQDPCPNHNCPFSKNDFCTNDIVNKGIAPCASKGIPKKKSQLNLRDKNGRVNIIINAEWTERAIREGVLSFEQDKISL